MKRFALSLPAVVVGLVIAPNLASALSAVTAEPANLRAGPSFDFPVVDRIPADVRVNVHGCVRGYRWCDVSWRDARGWVPGNELAYLYDNRRVTIIEYGPRIGLPVVVFSFDTYWDRHYRSRSWYGDRARWRTVWREREGIDKRSTDRRREDARKEVDRRSSDRSERRMDRRSDREQRPSIRSERGDRGELGQGRGYNPPGFRQETDRGPRRGEPGRGRPEPSVRSQKGSEGGHPGDGRRRDN
jgi:uncharacterized protein YraI